MGKTLTHALPLICEDRQIIKNKKAPTFLIQWKRLFIFFNNGNMDGRQAKDPSDDKLYSPIDICKTKGIKEPLPSKNLFP